MRNKKVNIIVLIAFVLIIGVSLYYMLSSPINLGLDLKGGTQIILRPVEGDGSDVTDESLDKAMLIILDRIDMLGISEPLVTRDISNNIVIQLPGVSDPDRALQIIGKTAQLEFRVLEGTIISRTGQTTGFIGFDPDTGRLIYDGQPEEIILVDGINSTTPVKTGVLYEDPESGVLFLMDRDFVPEAGAGQDTSGSSEAGDEEVGSSSPAGDEDGTSNISGALGKFVYNEQTRELNLLDIDTEEIIGELLIDSRTDAASLVGPVLLTGDKLAKASAGYDSNGRIVVTLSFKEEGAGTFEDITREYTGEQLAIVLDEEIKSAPSINTVISGGDAVIEGINSLDEARDIALVLQTGALPVNLIIEESSTVGPTLGRDSLDKGIYAGIIGLALIIIFMIAYYRGLGLISTLSLAIYILVFWGIMASIGAALTLPGIAGIILTIGMAVDANV
ncbi:MAG: protein translocase subunit SecD, partial [Actinomycetia bacterium]|nr:protein translocase subunit SecD [Actinomycetes bacterium]